MDCHDVRVLLALQRREGAIDPTERAALQQHLYACPDCAALSHSEQVIDAALGSAMRAVAVPTGLRTRVLTRLAVTRPRRWPKVAAVAAAVVLLALGVGTTWWAMRAKTAMSWTIVDTELVGRHGAEPDAVEHWYADHGIEMATWRQLDHRYLWSFDIVEFRGRRVPKLIFYKDDQGPSAIAEVLVLSTRQFDMHELPDEQVNAGSLRVIVQRPRSNDDYVYVMATSAESTDPFMRTPR